MRDSSSGLEHQTPESVATTMRHMSEAVTYLIRVASDAGLGGVARKLRTVRASIQRTQFQTGDIGTDETKPGPPS